MREHFFTHPTHIYHVSVMCRGLLWGLELEIREGEGTVPALLGAFAAHERAQTNTLENVRKQLLSWLRTSTWGVQEKCESQAEKEGQSREGTRGRHQRQASENGQHRGSGRTSGSLSPSPRSCEPLESGARISICVASG